MVVVTKPTQPHVDSDALEGLEDIICGLSDCLRALLALSRQGSLVNLIQEGCQKSITTTLESNPKPLVPYGAFAVESFECAEAAEKLHWMKVGAAFPHGDGMGFNVELAATPVNGKLVIRVQETSG